LGGVKPGVEVVQVSDFDLWVTSRFSELLCNNPHPDNLLVADDEDRLIFPIFLSNGKERSLHLKLLANKLYLPKARMQIWGLGQPFPFDLLLKRCFTYNLSPFQKVELHDKEEFSRVDLIIRDFTNNRSEFVKQVQDVFISSKNKIVSSGDKKNPFAILDIKPNALKRRCPECYELISELFNIYRGFVIAMSKDTMRNALQNPQYVPSLCEISRQVGLSTDNLKIIDNDLANAIISKRGDYKKMQRRKTVESNIQEAIDCAKQLADKGTSVNGSSLRSHLNQPGVLRNPEILRAVYKYIAEINHATNSINLKKTM
jgi:hypothetical protein